MCVYNIGVPLTSVMLLVRGIAQVLNISLTAAMNSANSGIAGVGHILTVIGLILLLLSLRKTVKK